MGKSDKAGPMPERAELIALQCGSCKVNGGKRSSRGEASVEPCGISRNLVQVSPYCMWSTLDSHYNGMTTISSEQFMLDLDLSVRYYTFSKSIRQ